MQLPRLGIQFIRGVLTCMAEFLGIIFTLVNFPSLWLLTMKALIPVTYLNAPLFLELAMHREAHECRGPLAPTRLTPMLWLGKFLGGVGSVVQTASTGVVWCCGVGGFHNWKGKYLLLKRSYHINYIPSLVFSQKTELWKTRHQLYNFLLFIVSSWIWVSMAVSWSYWEHFFTSCLLLFRSIC